MSENTPTDPATPDWREGMNAQLREFVDTRGLTSAKGVAQAFYDDVQARSGDDMIRLPGKDASPEELDAHWRRLGAPARAEEYAFAYPEGSARDEPLEQAVREGMHKYRVPREMGEGLWRELIARNQAYHKDAMDRLKADDEEQIKQLKIKYGDGYDAVVRRGLSVVKALEISPEMHNTLNDLLGVGVVADLLGRLGTRFGEEQTVHGFYPGEREHNIPIDEMSAQQAHQELRNKSHDKKYTDALYDQMHPDHAAIKQHWLSLHARLADLEPGRY